MKQIFFKDSLNQKKRTKNVENWKKTMRKNQKAEGKRAKN